MHTGSCTWPISGLLGHGNSLTGTLNPHYTCTEGHNPLTILRAYSQLTSQVKNGNTITNITPSWPDQLPMVHRVGTDFFKRSFDAVWMTPSTTFIFPNFPGRVVVQYNHRGWLYQPCQLSNGGRDASMDSRVVGLWFLLGAIANQTIIFINRKRMSSPAAAGHPMWQGNEYK